MDIQLFSSKYLQFCPINNYEYTKERISEFRKLYQQLKI